MLGTWEKFYSKYKDIKGSDPLNISNLEFVRDGESVEEYSKRIEDYFIFSYYKSNYNVNEPFLFKRWIRERREYIPYTVKKWLRYTKLVLNSPFFDRKNSSVGIIFDKRNLPNFMGWGFHFKEITVHNYKHNTNHKISDLYFYMHRFNEDYFFGFRTSHTPMEIHANYEHSHLYRRSIQERRVGNLNWCLGSGPLTRFTPNYWIENQDFIDSFLQLLNGYLRTESTEGGPYIHFEGLYNSLSSTNAPIKNFKPVLNTISKYVTFKYANGSIISDIKDTIIDDKDIIEYFGVLGDENGNTPRQANAPRSKNQIDIIGVKPITHQKVINNTVFKKRLPSNFIKQLKNKLEEDVNQYTNKEAIFTGFNSARSGNTSTHDQGNPQRDQVHVFETLEC